MIKHFGTQKENERGTDNMNCHSNSGCINVIAKRAPNYCLGEMIDAFVEEGESYVDITKSTDDSSTTWAQPDAVFPEKASQLYFHATAVAGPKLPEHLENFTIPQLGLYDLDAFTLNNHKPLTKKQKGNGGVQLPLLDEQRKDIARITVEQLLAINWAFHRYNQLYLDLNMVGQHHV